MTTAKQAQRPAEEGWTMCSFARSQPACGRLCILAASVLLAAGCGGDTGSTSGVDASAAIVSETQASNASEGLTSTPVEEPAPAPNPVPLPLPGTPPTPARSPAAAAVAGRAIATPVYGVTVDDISGLPAITQSLSGLPRMPTTRIVFDEFRPAKTYLAATAAIGQVSYVMGEILDSLYMPRYSVQAYRDRTAEYLATLGPFVDIWEVANEINGEWLGDNGDVVAKMTDAFDLVKAQGKTAALTLYYNEGCASKAAHTMFAWAQAHIPARMKSGLDYVWISYYEDDCPGPKPDWDAVFQRLSVMFPGARLGFGEVGTAIPARKAEFVTRYYTLSIKTPSYVGGYFWWSFRKDMVPSTAPLWSTLSDAIAAR